jgi:hypothetical protein
MLALFVSTGLLKKKRFATSIESVHEPVTGVHSTFFHHLPTEIKNQAIALALYFSLAMRTSSGDEKKMW